jgi:hypothetical protein
MARITPAPASNAFGASGLTVVNINNGLLLYVFEDYNFEEPKGEVMHVISNRKVLSK